MSRRGVRWHAAVAGVAVGIAVAFGWRVGPPLGLAAFVVVERLGRRPKPALAGSLRRRASADLPLAIDLLAASLLAGAPPQRATQVVGVALGGPVGERLVAVASALANGRDAKSSWCHVIDLPAGERLARSAARSADSGAALSAVLSRFAGDLRTARATTAEAAARRLSVLVVVPLGLCYLPAFLLAGVAPVVLAVLSQVLAGH